MTFKSHLNTPGLKREGRGSGGVVSVGDIAVVPTL